MHPKVKLTETEVEEVLNVEPWNTAGLYKPTKFKYERDQALGQFDGNDDGERCYNDHVRCLTSITNQLRKICGINEDGKRADFASMCEMYLDNCNRNQILGRNRKINLTLEILEEILNVDVGHGDFKPMSFQYENDQNLGKHESKDDGERCYNDHVRCLTTLMTASRPVCGIATDGKTNDFGSMCDLYLDNCKRRKDHWRVVDGVSCVNAKKITYYHYGEAVVPDGLR